MDSSTVNTFSLWNIKDINTI